MNKVSIVIKGIRYDVIEKEDDNSTSQCAFYSKKYHCVGCIIGMEFCKQLIGGNRIFKKSNKSIRDDN